jgi:drug/metabolite transporter (DMT)-like permease
MESRNNFKGIVHIYAAFFLAGTSIVAGKILGREVNVIISVTLSLVISLAILIPIHIKTLGMIKKITVTEFTYLLFQAVTGIVLTRFFTLKGLTLTTSVNAGMITSFTPALMALASFWVFKEKISKRKILALFFSVLGVVIINYGDFHFVGKDSLLGSFLILLSILSEVSMSVIKKHRGYTIPPLTNTVLLYLISLTCFLPFFILNRGALTLAMLDPVYISTLLFYGIFGSALAYIFWSSGVVKVSGFVVSQAFTMIPLTAVVLAPIILKEPFSKFHFAGIVLVLIGTLVGWRNTPSTEGV